MSRWTVLGVGLVVMGLGSGCADRLASIQEGCKGTWQLATRELPDGTILRPPSVRGAICWIPIDSRKEHVTASVEIGASGQAARTFDYASSVYEVSTSAASKKRHLLIRQGYRLSAAVGSFATYAKEKTAKGKVSLEDGRIRMSHEGRDEKGRGVSSAKGFYQVYNDDTMTASFTGGVQGHVGEGSSRVGIR